MNTAFSTISNLPMPIKTPRMLLRIPQVNDAIPLNKAIVESFHELHQYMLWAKTIPSIDESKQWIKTITKNTYLNNIDTLPIFMFDALTNEFIGATGYNTINWNVPCLELGYWIKTSCSGKGFATEAVNALTQYAFTQLNVKRIAITCDPTNIRSKKIPARLGYCIEGIMKYNNITATGQIRDTLIFARYNLNSLPTMTVTW